MRKVIMQNLPAQSVNAPEKVGCFRNNTPNHTLTDLKARQSSKIREIGNALITAGIVSLDAQAKALGLPRSTAWTILSAEHKGTGISARIICRMLNSEPLPLLVRAKIVEYAKEKAAGIYGGTEMQHRRFASKLKSNGRTNGLRRRQPALPRDIRTTPRFLKSANIWNRPARWRVAVEALEQLGHARCCVLG